MDKTLISRKALGWLLIAQFAVMVPLLQRMPDWVLIAWLATAVWHWQIYSGRVGFPGGFIKTPLAIMAIAGIWLEYKNPAALEFQVGMLVAAFILKLLELRSRRDIWVVIGLGYFIICCGFLFEQLFLNMLVALLQLVVLLLAQMSLYSRGMKVSGMSAKLIWLLAGAGPLMLLLFVLFPRIGPLWSMPVPGTEFRTGMKDRISPGDISRLGRSGELAFRVEFKDEIPERRELYFRALVLENFDGRTWSRSGLSRRHPRIRYGDARGIAYEITLQPGVHEWLYAMTVPLSSRTDLRMDANYLLIPDKPISGRFRYPVVSYPDMALNLPLDLWAERRNLALPPRGNPRARLLGGEWEGKHAAPRQRLQAAINYLSALPFRYTLEPEALGENSVDDFLFGTREGFCEHFASSFVFLMRAAGVPARVVVGYQGGEINPRDSTLLVHQSDAHAWTEVWLGAEAGWTRVDPTALIAPQRISAGIDAALGDSAAYLSDSVFSLRHLSQYASINQFRFWLDSMEYSWAKWVLNYNRDQQWSLLRDLFGDISVARMAMFILILAALPLIIVALTTIKPWHRQYRPPVIKAYQRCLKKLEKEGLVRNRSETPTRFAQRVARERPEFSEWLDQVTQSFVQGVYAPGGSEAVATAELRQLSKRFINNA